MNRHLLVLATALAVLLPARARSDEASDAPSLEEELAAILGEILESDGDGVNPFEEGAIPDLVVLGSSNTVGEVAPCG